jgi:phage protein D
MASPKPDNPLVPDFSVTIDGSPLPAHAVTHVAGVDVDESVDMPGMFTLELASSDNQQRKTSWIDDQKLFGIGNVVEIKLGYVDDLETLLIAEIAAVEPTFVSNRPPSMTVRGFDRLHRLARGRKTRTFLKQKDSEIASQIAQEANLTAQVEDSAIVHDYVFQHNQSDLEFLRMRANRINYEVLVEDKKLIFRKVANAQSAVLTLTMDEDLLEFKAYLSSSAQVSEVSVRAWSPKDKRELVGKAKTGDEVSTMGGQKSGAALVEGAFGQAVYAISEPVATQAEADELAKARLNQLVLELVSAEGICWGRTDLRAGKVIKIEGVGTRFSGDYYVTAAVHRYSTELGYITDFRAGRNAS